MKTELAYMTKRHNIQAEKFENKIHTMLADIEENRKPELTNKVLKSGQTSIIQKLLIELTKDLWSNVVPTKCPHCKMNSPAFRKDGYTKMFVKPLSGKTQEADKQRARL